MVFFVKDAWVWLEHNNEAWLPVQLKEQNGDKIICKSDLDEEFIIDANTEMSTVKPSSLVPCNNMVKLEELSEGAILHNLRMRYNNDDIYTYISSILISVNPFKMLPIYSPSVMKDYQNKLSAREEMPPHVYALADDTFRSLIIDKTPQSVIISGESGAGKTEATKLVLQYLTEMSGQGSRIEQQLLQANPIIEAFGNAKTVRNNNSSRFGKWIEIALDKEYHIAGARIINYLLEKSRIVAQGPGERNYHAFYQFCAGANQEERQKYMIGKSNEYRYLSGGDCFVVDGINDISEFNNMKRALEVMYFTADERDFLFSVISSVMHLGNIKFSGGDKCQISDRQALENTCKLLKVDTNTMCTALITKTIKVVGESITTPLTVEHAYEGVDALSKALYGSLFNWLIERINSVLHVELEQSHTVGVLDIFGFEIFETNRFEQFCVSINEDFYNIHLILYKQYPF